MIDISKLHFHDARILRVVEEPQTDQLIMEVDYPVDREKNRFEKRKLVFKNCYNYQVKEIPMEGCPTIVDAMIIGENEGWTKLRLETSAGCRELFCQSVELTA